ncbi:MAG: hypothetical protein JGK17_21480 [Microcoleus sp. PH2017_10_PVI_O_A]|uniref:hypothetical protein n=1 Tax=unclassified Microcoleus TaxID=2642155 RepID=UPI001D9D3F77|nr:MULTISPECIES: hypothetical protein [unclassified Microcoleus]MCC3542971.1 hypothetical protein [Microcoleus sp. PH2017_22_RUC_O_B]MCC3408110.1 hypothetical protein [Microcoleus sp. PH2017_10_PVI_O_A]MCC3462232.1 hypothetical protein [Microcoleus sp. PH2017_11_PCY_U_A]MCC3480698.1 hypothetical protein [Microcoleus sp. PH2017_12_PCY_D_A]MCC3530583.1 hypothetical protein [Microcoleus sp. PH2017_21_RUC_O_A]
MGNSTSAKLGSDRTSNLAKIGRSEAEGWGMGHGASGMGHGASGIGHRASGIGHRAFLIPSPSL